ncbi:MAG: hypothetical protein PHE68_04285 [Candidatus Peribacteraceae bacterium]|nr:hypothetical protein [Candidatus Peribacteraceae bacterium]MDD5074748.1 hypothetical protein [Candidatus Peribacteraceae bacterium]
MRRILTIIGLEVLAVTLVIVAMSHGVTTDEAKYLLNIPYPHPPLLRGIVGITRFLPGQEFFWRLMFATLLLQAVWFVISFLPDREHTERFALGCLWILSAAVFTLAGQILMAPATALFALVFCRLLLQQDEDSEDMAGWIALLWLASLFTAYQAILFVPIVFTVFWRMRLPLGKKLLCIAGPVLLLVIYSATNPFAVASMVTAGEQNAGAGTLFDALRGTGRLWIVGGSVVLSILGTIGMVSSRRWSLVLSLLLVAAFITVSFRPYYCILFTPLFIAGVAAHPRLLRMPAITLVLTIFFSAFIVPRSLPSFDRSPARVTMQTLAANRVTEGMILIAGPFGHEWQYESSLTVRRYGPRLIDSSRAVICLADCPEVRWRKNWRILPGLPVEVWMRTLAAWKK